MTLPIFWPVNEQREVMRVFLFAWQILTFIWHVTRNLHPANSKNVIYKIIQSSVCFKGLLVVSACLFPKCKKKETTAKNPSLYSSQGKHRRILLNGPVHQSKLQSHEKKLSSRKVLLDLASKFHFCVGYPASRMLNVQRLLCISERSVALSLWASALCLCGNVFILDTFVKHEVTFLSFSWVTYIENWKTYPLAWKLSGMLSLIA